MNALTGAPNYFHCANAFETRPESQNFVDQLSRRILECLPGTTQSLSQKDGKDDLRFSGPGLHEHSLLIRTQPQRGFASEPLYVTLWLRPAEDLLDRGILDRIEKLRSRWIAALSNDSDFDEARRIKEEIVELTKQAYGERHPRVAEALQSLARENTSDPSPLRRLQKVAWLQEALDILDAQEVPPVDRVDEVLSSLGSGLLQTREWDRAIGVFTRRMKLAANARGEKHPEYIAALRDLGLAHQQAATEGYGERGSARLAEAERLFEQAISLLEASRDSDKRTILNLYGFLLNLLELQGKDDVVERLYMRVLLLENEVLKAQRSKDGLDIFEALAFYTEPLYHLSFVRFLVDRSETARAETLISQGLNLMRGLSGNDNVATLSMRTELALLLARTGRHEAAVAETNRVISILEKEPDTDTGPALMLLGMVHDIGRRYDKAANAFRRALEVMLKRDNRGEKASGYIEVASLAGEAFRRAASSAGACVDC